MKYPEIGTEIDFKFFLNCMLIGKVDYYKEYHEEHSTEIKFLNYFFYLALYRYKKKKQGGREYNYPPKLYGKIPEKMSDNGYLVVEKILEFIKEENLATTVGFSVHNYNNICINPKLCAPILVSMLLDSGLFYEGMIELARNNNCLIDINKDSHKFENLLSSVKHKLTDADLDYLFKSISNLPPSWSKDKWLYQRQGFYNGIAYMLAKTKNLNYFLESILENENKAAIFLALNDIATATNYRSRRSEQVRPIAKMFNTETKVKNFLKKAKNDKSSD